MAGSKITPRQKMIKMMYLVLTALLAFKVFKEIINSFFNLKNNLEVSNKNTKEKKKTSYYAFEFAMKNNPVKTKPYYDKAMSTKKLADQMSTYIDSLKNALVIKADGIDIAKGEKVPPLIEMEDKENYDVPTQILCGQENDGK